MKIRLYILFLLFPALAFSQQYNILKQDVCWTTPTAVDSSLSRLVYVSVSGGGPLAIVYLNGAGANVDVSGGGTFQLGYCGCCDTATALTTLYYGDELLANGDTINNLYIADDTLTGNRTVYGLGRNITWDSIGQYVIQGEGTAESLVRISASSSIPHIIRQISGTDTVFLQLSSNTGRATVKGTQGVFVETAANSFNVDYFADGDTNTVIADGNGNFIPGEWPTNADYSNHVFLSKQGVNSTGELGNFARPFRDPWTAQDSLSGQTNLSFLAYDGEYSYSGPYLTNNTTRLTKTDTFSFYSLSPNIIENSGASGNSFFATGQFISDISPANTTNRQKIDIFAPHSVFSAGASTGSISIAAGVYDENTEFSLTARKLQSTNTGGDAWGIQSGNAYTRVKLDTLQVKGRVAIGIYTPYLAGAATTKTRSQIYDIGFLEQTSPVTSEGGLIRIQFDPSFAWKDTASFFSVDIDKVQALDANLLLYTTNGDDSIKDSRIKINVGEFNQANSSSKAMLNISELSGGSPPIVGTQFTINVGKTNAKNGNMDLGGTGGQTFKDGSLMEINIGDSYAAAGANNAVFSIANLTLEDSSVFKLHCERCFIQPGDRAIYLESLNIPSSSQLIISGNFYAADTTELIYLDANTDISGLVIENARFIATGNTTPWIESATGPDTITMNNVYSNSDSLLNVFLKSNLAWGFQSEQGKTNDLQTILNEKEYLAYASLSFAQDTTVIESGKFTTASGGASASWQLEGFSATDSTLTWNGTDTLIAEIVHGGSYIFSENNSLIQTVVEISSVEQVETELIEEEGGTVQVEAGAIPAIVKIPPGGIIKLIANSDATGTDNLIFQRYNIVINGLKRIAP